MDSYTITIAPNDDSGSSTRLVVDSSGGQVRITDVHLHAAEGLSSGHIPNVDFGLLLLAVTGGSPGQDPAGSVPVGTAAVGSAGPGVREIESSVPEADEPEPVARSPRRSTAAKTTPRAATKSAARTATNSAPRAAAKSAAKATPRSAAGNATKSAARTATTSAPRIATKAATESAPRTATKSAPRTATKTAAKAATEAAKQAAVQPRPAAKAPARKTQAKKATAVRRATPAKKATPEGLGRVYRRTPDDLAAVFEQAGTVAAVAAHYQVPRYTAQGWIGRLRATR